MSRKRCLVIAPGRGSYTKADLGYFARRHPTSRLLEQFDRQRIGQQSLQLLDNAPRFSTKDHMTGDNASALIHACALADFQAIDRDQHDIVAVTGNSMGWYIALACAGAVSRDDGFTITNTMGTLMHSEGVGGQVLYPVVDAQWQPDPVAETRVAQLLVDTPDLYLSIRLGGMCILAGSDAALRSAEKALPLLEGRFPMRLAHHAAFHSPLVAPVSDTGQARLPATLFTSPDIPMIDGTGTVWAPHAVDAQALHHYTLSTQVTETYDFTRAVQNGLREFAPDQVILLGPGNSLGAAVGQAMVEMGWRGMRSKDDFKARQEKDPVLLSLGHI